MEYLCFLLIIESSDSEVISDSDVDYVPSDTELYKGLQSPEQPDILHDVQEMVTNNKKIGTINNMSEIESTNTSMITVHTRIRRKHVCIYCSQSVTNFVRHLERNHQDELEVQKFMNLDKKSVIRLKLIDKLRREGDFCTTNIIPVKLIKDKETSDYIPCKFCRGYYARRSLRRHAKKCHFNPNPSLRLNAQIEGQTLMAGHFGPNDILKRSGLLDMMRADNVSLVAKKDNIICEVARRYIRSHREKHLLMVAKRNMRRLSRLLISARTIGNENFRFIDILHPNKFQLLIKATKHIAEYNEVERTFKSSSLALQMGTLLKNAINTAYSLTVQSSKQSSDQLQHLENILKLIETDWANEISSEAGQNLNINKYNKVTLIPAAEDIKVKFLNIFVIESSLVEKTIDDHIIAYSLYIYFLIICL